MYKILFSKIRRAVQLFREKGYKGAARSAGQYWLWRTHTGLIIEMLGDEVVHDTMRFSVRSPAIARAHKWRLLNEDYERAERTLLERHLTGDVPVVELGGSAGVVACLTNRRLKDPAQHIVVEAHPQLFQLLQHNRNLNGCQFTSVHAALAYSDAEITFSLDPENSLCGSASTKRSDISVQVPAMSLREILDMHQFRVCDLVCDIEGAELELIEREGDLLASRVRSLCIEFHGQFHGETLDDEAVSRVKNLGFTLKDQVDCVYYFENRKMLAVN